MKRGILRDLAQKVVHFAMQDERLNRCAWPIFIARQLDSIRGDAKALIWSIGVAWGLRGERVIGSITPATNCLLLFPAIYCFSHFLLRRLVWYGVPPISQGQSEDARGLLRLALCALVLALVGSLAPGHARRRVFVASAFPFIAMAGLTGAAAGLEWINAVGSTYHHQIALALIRGVLVGLTMTAVLTLPALLLYRNVAVPIVMLSLVPAIARSNWTARFQIGDSQSLAQWLSFASPFVCTAIGIMIATAVCRRWQHYVLLPTAYPQSKT